MKLIKLTALNGGQFCINSNLILKVWSSDNGSVIKTNDDELFVLESMDQIIAQCNKK